MAVFPLQSPVCVVTVSIKVMIQKCVWVLPVFIKDRLLLLQQRFSYLKTAAHTENSSNQSKGCSAVSHCSVTLFRAVKIILALTQKTSADRAVLERGHGTDRCSRC